MTPNLKYKSKRTSHVSLAYLLIIALSTCFFPVLSFGTTPKPPAESEFIQVKAIALTVLGIAFLASLIIICILLFFLQKQKKSQALLMQTKQSLHTAEDMLEKDRQIGKLQNDLQGVLDALPYSVLIRDINANLLYVNDAYCKLLEFPSREEAMKHKIIYRSPEFQPDGRKSSDIVLFHNDQLSDYDPIEPFEWRFVLSNDRILDVLVSGIQITFNDETAFAVIIQDITAERMQEQMLKNTAEKEREANQIKSRFVMNMSHEIRTPMNAIIGLSEIALMKNYDREALDTIKKINVSAKHLLSIVNDVLDFSKIEAEKLELIMENFSLEDTLSNALLVASGRLGTKKIEMLIQYDVELPDLVYGDRTRTWQVFKNLLDNSAKFTEEGHITLSVSHRCDESNEEIYFITFVLEDTGIGMSKDDLEKLASPFEQFHKDSASATTGTGLGMTITSELVKVMGGSLQVESELGKGTRTTICLPFIAGTHITLKEELSKNDLSGKQVLLVDDDPMSLEIMGSLLSIMNAKTMSVESGEAAIEAVSEAKSQGRHFDIILLDYYMRGKNGIETAYGIKAISDNHAKLLMVSAYSKQLLVDDIEKAGFNGIIEKPFSPTSFAQKIYNALYERRPEETIRIRSDFAGKNILLVEDNFINQEVAVSMLREFGIEPVIAENGLVALKQLETTHFDLVFMDLSMPIMDGHETTKQIRASEKPYADVPIIAMTANVVKEEIDRCFSDGMNGHIGKPIDINILTSHLERWLG